MNKKLQECVEAIEQLKSVSSTNLEARQLLYSKLKASREQASFALMMRMDPPTLTAMRKEFFMKEDTVSLEEFVFILRKHLIQSSPLNELERKEFAANMIDLFKEIDVNGDAGVSWIEFTSYIVEKASTFKHHFKHTHIAHYANTTKTLHPISQQWRRFDYAKLCPLPNAQFAALEDLRKSIFVFNSKTGYLNRTIHTPAVPLAITYGRDSNSDLLIASCSDMSIIVQNLDEHAKKRSGATLHTWSTQDIQMSLAYMNSSSLLYSGAYRSISSWNLKERKEADSQIPHAHSDIVTDMIILKNLDTLVSCSLDRTIVNWDTSTNQAIATYDGHRTGVFNLSYSPAYRLLFSVGFDHDALVWSPFVGGMVYRLKGHMHTLVGCYASESKPEVVTADQSGTFKLWDVRNFECVQTWQMNDLDETQQPSLPTALSAFSFQSWPSDDPSQTDAHCRILAASKTISCFDQVRVKKQSTSDSAAVQAIYWNEVKSTVITVSECNVIVWDALVGSVIFFNENVQADITASCLDDRKRKVILGNLEGDIIVVNPANGVRMKSGSTYHKISAAVATLSYLDGKQQFVAGYANGYMCLYDESSGEECRLLKMLERSHGFDTSDKLICVAYDTFNSGLLSADTTRPVVKIWNASSGKCTGEITVSDDAERICKIVLLDPYPLVLTADTGGNCYVFGAPGFKFLDYRLTGWMNQTPAGAHIEAKQHQTQDQDRDIPHRVVPLHQHATRRASLKLTQRVSEMVSGNLAFTDDFQQYRDDVEDADEGPEAEEYFDHEDKNTLALAQAISEATSSEMVWGLASLNTICFDSKSLSVFAGDEKGTLRKFSLLDFFNDIDAESLIATPPRRPRLRGACKLLPRNQRSALVPVHEKSINYLVGKRKEVSYLGVNFEWAIAAHQVRMTALCNTGRGVVTAADDKMVKMWSYDGYLLGVLKQNVPSGVKSSTWNLTLDITPYLQKETADVTKILRDVDSIDSTAFDDDVSHYDFSGLEPGAANSAIFARSELRRRIELSAKILVLDFADSSSSSNKSLASVVADESSVTSLADSVSISSKVSKTSLQALMDLRSTDDHTDISLNMTSEQKRRKDKAMKTLSATYIKKTGADLPLVGQPLHESSQQAKIFDWERETPLVMSKSAEKKSSFYNPRKHDVSSAKLQAIDEKCETRAGESFRALESALRKR